MPLKGLEAQSVLHAQFGGLLLMLGCCSFKNALTSAVFKAQLINIVTLTNGTFTCTR